MSGLKERLDFAVRMGAPAEQPLSLLPLIGPGCRFQARQVAGDRCRQIRGGVVAQTSRHGVPAGRDPRRRVRGQEGSTDSKRHLDLIHGTLPFICEIP